MKVTSSQASKMLRKLEEDRRGLLNNEDMSSSFNAAVGENIEDVRPKYDYEGVRKAVDEIDAKIRGLKHSINLFNVSYVIPEFGMTIDQILVYIPQLSAKKALLDRMRNTLPKTRANDGYRAGSVNIIDYTYANYDIEKTDKDFSETSDLLARVQTALDTVNNTVTFDVDM